MKKIIYISVLSLVLFSCGDKKNPSIDKLIESKNVQWLQQKKAALQADIARIEEALAGLDVKKEEALVSVITLKDTIFNHYLDIQGSVDTKENILIQPEFSGTLIALNVKTGD